MFFHFSILYLYLFLGILFLDFLTSPSPQNYNHTLCKMQGGNDLLPGRSTPVRKLAMYYKGLAIDAFPGETQIPLSGDLPAL